LKDQDHVASENRPSNNIGIIATLLTIVIVVAVLYFARVVFIPLALAIVLAFLLAPLVIRLRSWGLGRVPSSLIVVFLAFVGIAIIGTLVVSQMADVGRKLPGYQQNVRQKLHSIGTSSGGFITKVSRSVQSLTDELIRPASTQENRGNPEEKPVPVEIRKGPFAPMELVQGIIGSIFNAVLIALIVIVFVVFLLIQREDLRDRLIRLVGTGRVQVTTEALDEAGHRLSRYLAAQLVVNTVFGLLAGFGLRFIGVPDPALWGLLAAVLRYVPYLGIWVAAAMPALVSFAVDPGWLKVPLIFGVYGGIDLVMYNFVEPYFYGTSTGISPVAILLAAVFWTWLWGPIGLLLSTPLTVCVVVLGRYVPSLEFLAVMLSDEPVLGPEMRFYQRMLAMNLDEAEAVASEFLKGKSLEELTDQVLVPALSLAEEDRHRGRLDEKRQQFIFQNTRMLVEEIGEQADEVARGKKLELSKNQKSHQHEDHGDETGSGIVLVPARDEADEIAAMMLGQLLERRGIKGQVLSCAALAGECIEKLKHSNPKIACVVVVPPYGYMHARYMCRRLRDQFSELKVIAAILTEREVEELRQRRPPVAADELTVTLKQALAAILSFLPGAEAEPKVRPEQALMTAA
jgi:predicted PurR-regulated permease PerM